MKVFIISKRARWKSRKLSQRFAWLRTKISLRRLINHTHSAFNFSPSRWSCQQPERSRKTFRKAQKFELFVSFHVMKMWLMSHEHTARPLNTSIINFFPSHYLRKCSARCVTGALMHAPKLFPAFFPCRQETHKREREHQMIVIRRRNYRRFSVEVKAIRNLHKALPRSKSRAARKNEKWNVISNVLRFKSEKTQPR